MNSSSRSPDRYREDAAHFRRLAAAITDSAELRDSYLALSIEYERLASLLERAASLSSSPMAKLESTEVSASVDKKSSRRERARAPRRG